MQDAVRTGMHENPFLAAAYGVESVARMGPRNTWPEPQRARSRHLRVVTHTEFMEMDIPDVPLE